MQKGQFQLLGTIITDEMRVAIVKEISSGKERQIVQGFTINGLQLEMVEADRIVFTQYEDREEIRLKIQRSAAPVAKPVSAPVSAPQGGQPAKPQAAPATATQPAGTAQGAGVSAGRIERPAVINRPPQTMEDRKNNPLLKDFYK
jgi:type II secretory pathway component PulC